MASHSQQPRGDRLVIGIAGRIGSGKTSVGHHLNSRYGFQYLRYSQVLSEWLAKDAESKTHLQEVGWKVMAGGMQTELNRRLIAQILPEGDFAVDGLRHPIDHESLKDSFPESFHLVYIESSSKLRWEHLKGRSKYADFASFHAVDSHPVEQQIETLRASAARVLKNESSLEVLYSELETAIQEFRKEGHA
jgi:dephospho-CoA kinase